MKSKAPVPIWSKKAQKKLIDKNMSKKELAERINVNYRQMVNVMTGYVYNETIKQKVCEFLQIGG